MQEREVRCHSCDGEMVYEVPPSAAYDCPELVCTGCGTAEVLAPVTLYFWRRPGSRRVAPQQRRAAA